MNQWRVEDQGNMRLLRRLYRLVPSENLPNNAHNNFENNFQNAQHNFHNLNQNENLNIFGQNLNFGQEGLNYPLNPFCRLLDPSFFSLDSDTSHLHASCHS